MKFYKEFELTQKTLLELFIYDAITGIFYRKIKVANRSKVGEIAGYKDNNGYHMICINRKYYSIHRLAWLYVTGKWPLDQIDHINGIRNDNRICNLREVTNQQNTMNKATQSNNTSGHKGVCRYGRKWSARIMVNRKSLWLSAFEDYNAAVEAYCVAAKKIHGEFTNDR